MSVGSNKTWCAHNDQVVSRALAPSYKACIVESNIRAGNFLKLAADNEFWRKWGFEKPLYYLFLFFLLSMFVWNKSYRMNG